MRKHWRLVCYRVTHSLRNIALALLLKEGLYAKKYVIKFATYCTCATDTPRRKPGRRRKEDIDAIEADTDTDDELFRCKRTRGSQRGKEGKPTVKKEVVMNGDDMGDHEEEEDEGLSPWDYFVSMSRVF